MAGFPADYAGVSFFSVDLGECEVRLTAPPALHPPAGMLPSTHLVSRCANKPITWIACHADLHCTLILCYPQELGELLDVRTLPTFLLLRRGAEAARLEGVPQQRPARALAQAIRQHLLPGELQVVVQSPAAEGSGSRRTGQPQQQKQQQRRQA